MMTLASEAIAWVLKHWKVVIPCLAVLAIGVWGAAQAHGKEKAKRAEAEVRLEMQTLIADHEKELTSREDVIKALRASLSDWETQATEAAQKAEDAERAAQALRDAHNQQRGRLESEIRSLADRLASLPEAERYEETRVWAIETYRRILAESH